MELLRLDCEWLMFDIFFLFIITAVWHIKPRDVLNSNQAHLLKYNLQLWHSGTWVFKFYATFNFHYISETWNI